MTPAQAIASLPDTHVLWSPETGPVTVGQVRGERVRYITTEEAARIFSYRPETWARWAPEIPGAFKDRLWRLPLAGCEAHIRRRSEPRRRKRRPWDATETSHALADRASHMEAR